MLNARFTMSQAKRMFFDRALIDRKVDRAILRQLSKAGAFIRQRARSSIRKRKKASKPGKPPTNRKGLLRNNIVFVYDPDSRSVVIGPTLLNMIFFNGDGQPVKGTVPGVLEAGGQISMLMRYIPYLGKWVRADLRSRRRLVGNQLKRRTVTIAARPFMGPAFEAERPKFAQLFLNSVN
jgi:phage gpG-like protein